MQETKYEHYKKARDAVWRTMLKSGVDRLPISLQQIAATYGIKVIAFSDFPVECLPYITSGIDGVSGYLAGRRTILLNDIKGNKGRRRFTLGHELAHHIMGHPLVDLVWQKELPSLYGTYYDYEANTFSRNLLAPACVLSALDIHTTDEIMNLCGMSRTAAEIRAERLKVLYDRNLFGKHELERQVKRQFEAYIQSFCAVENDV